MSDVSDDVSVELLVDVSDVSVDVSDVSEVKNNIYISCLFGTLQIPWLDSFLSLSEKGLEKYYGCVGM